MRGGWAGVQASAEGQEMGAKGTHSSPCMQTLFSRRRRTPLRHCSLPEDCPTVLQLLAPVQVTNREMRVLLTLEPVPESETIHFSQLWWPGYLPGHSTCCGSSPSVLTLQVSAGLLFLTSRFNRRREFVEQREMWKAWQKRPPRNIFLRDNKIFK